MKNIAWNRKNVSIVLAAVIIPVSLVAVLALNSSPREVENITVDAVGWSMNRPSNNTDIDEWVKNVYNGNGISVSFEIWIVEYREDPPYFGDRVEFVENVVANVTEGFINSVVIRYQLDPASSDMMLDDDWFTLRNLKLQKIENYEQCVTTVGINQSQNCSLKHNTLWTMGYDNDVEQAVKVTAEILWWNGAYQKIHVPIDLFMHRGQTP
jgi:hypothetical protein